MKTYVKRLSAVILLLIIAAVPYIDDSAKAAEQKNALQKEPQQILNEEPALKGAAAGCQCTVSKNGRSAVCKRGRYAAEARITDEAADGICGAFCARRRLQV